jgi:hypothetical protein
LYHRRKIKKSVPVNISQSCLERVALMHLIAWLFVGKDLIEEVRRKRLFITSPSPPHLTRALKCCTQRKSSITFPLRATLSTNTLTPFYPLCPIKTTSICATIEHHSRETAKGTMNLPAAGSWPYFPTLQHHFLWYNCGVEGAGRA